MDDTAGKTGSSAPKVVRGFESALPLSLVRARAATAAKFRGHINAEGLSLPQWRVLRALGEGEPLDVSTIARRCALLQPSVSRLLKPLQGRGLVAPLHDGEDTRRRRVTLTTKGQEMFMRIGVISEAVYRDIEAAYGREDLTLLVSMLHRLREVVEAMPDLPLTMPELPETTTEEQAPCAKRQT